MRYLSTLFAVLFFLFPTGSLPAHAKAGKVFLLEDASKNQWCSYLSEPTWKTKVQEVGASTVGTLIYSNENLSQIDVTETDESGDWIVYDHYFLDDHGQIVKLIRLLNVLPGDRSVSQTFSISNGKAEKTTTSEKQLSNGKPVTTPAGDWLPDVVIQTAPKMFPFADLVSRPGVRSSPKSCVKISASQ